MGDQGWRVLVEHDRRWAEDFAALAERLRGALEGLDATVEHVGSTSVPGLAAKPMLDVDVVVPSADLVPAVSARLEALGYRAKGMRGVPGREAFDQPPDGPLQALYLVVAGSGAHLDHVLLRDILRRRPDLAARYEAVKRANADRLPDDALGYTDAKVEVIQDILRIARQEAGLPVDPDAVVLDGITYRWREPRRDGDVDELHRAAFDERDTTYDWRQARPLSLGWVTAIDGDELVGFANVAWDGGRHGFLLDVAVSPSYQRRGIGQRVVARAIDEARRGGCQWLHVDFEAHLAGFYAACGFTPTAAGLLDLSG